MLAINQLMNEIKSLPSEYFQEVADFVDYLKVKQMKNIPETMLLSEQSLSEHWNTPEEDEAWADL